MALTSSVRRASPPGSQALYISSRFSCYDDPQSPLAGLSTRKTSELDLTALAALMTSLHTPPLSSASSSTDSALDTPPTTINGKKLSRDILFGTGHPSSPLTGLRTDGIRHKRTLSFSATVLHRPSVASAGSFEGEGREEEFHASFPLPPGTEIDEKGFPYAHTRRSSLPGADAASIMAQLEETGKLLDEVLPRTPPPVPRSAVSQKDWPSPPERFRSRRSVYPESCFSLSPTLSSRRPSRDDTHGLPSNRDTVMSLPFVWADGSPIKRQPTNASRFRASLKRQKSAYAPFPESPKASSPIAADETFPFSEMVIPSQPATATVTKPASRGCGRLSARANGKNLTIATDLDLPSSVKTLKTETPSGREEDAHTVDPPSPVPSSIFLPDSLWPSPVLEPVVLPVGDMTPLDLDMAFDKLKSKIQPKTPDADVELESVLKDMQVILQAADQSSGKSNTTTTLSPKKAALPIPAPARQPILQHSVPKAKPNIVLPALKPTEPLRVNKTLPHPPLKSASPHAGQVPVKPVTIAQAGRSQTAPAAPLWTASASSTRDDVRDPIRYDSARSSPAHNSVSTPSHVKQSSGSPNLPVRSLKASPPSSVRSISPLKTPAPPRPVRSPSPLFLNGLDYLEDLHSPVPPVAATPSPDPFWVRSPSRSLETRARRDSFDSLTSDTSVFLRGADKASLLGGNHQFAQQIPSKAARKLGVPEEAVMVHNRSPSWSSNFGDHNTPVPTPSKPKKNPFGSFFTSPGRKETKNKLEISMPLPEPVEPVVLYTPSIKSPPPFRSAHHEQSCDEHGSFSWLTPQSTARSISPGASSVSRSRSPKGAPQIQVRRDTSNNLRWI